MVPFAQAKETELSFAMGVHDVDLDWHCQNSCKQSKYMPRCHIHCFNQQILIAH